MNFLQVVDQSCTLISLDLRLYSERDLMKVLVDRELKSDRLFQKSLRLLYAQSTLCTILRVKLSAWAIQHNSANCYNPANLADTLG